MKRTQEKKKELIDLRLRMKSNIISDNISRAFNAIQEELKDIELIRDDIKNIELNVEEKLEILLDALTGSNRYYLSNPLRKTVKDDKISWYGKPYVADAYIILPLKFEAVGDKEFLAFIPRTGLGSIVVEDITDNKLEMDIESRCMSSMIYSNNENTIIAGTLMTSASNSNTEYTKDDSNKEGGFYIHFNIDYHGYNITLKSDEVLDWLKLEVSKDGRGSVDVGPLRQDLNYLEVFDNDILDPSLLERLLGENKD